MGFSYSDAALRALFLRDRQRMTNAQYWKRCNSLRDLATESAVNRTELELLAEECRNKAISADMDGMICAFDDGFPVLNPFAPKGERPFLIFYRGDISLLEDLNKNVAVIGETNPDISIMERERNVVSHLTAKDLVIVSGLARGCDTMAHRACLDAGGRTIAVLPSSLTQIYPAENRALAEEIVEKGGLLLTEYFGEAKGRREAVKRFTDRDRLQAMFSKAVIMIASYLKGDGDSGSRFAMESAKKYGIRRYVMFDPAQDSEKKPLALNQYLLRYEPDVKALCRKSIEELAAIQDLKLAKVTLSQQLSLDMNQNEIYF